MIEAKGTLIPIGGNEDKGNLEEGETRTLEFITEGILSHVVREAGGIEAKIVVVPTASSIPDEVAQNYIDAFTKLGCQHIHILNARSKEDAESEESLQLLKTADCVMFSGGDQSRIVAAFAHTKAHEILQDRYQNDDFVIAGTSAGAMCMSHEMIAGGSNPDSFRKGIVIMEKGMSFLPQLIIDSHFILRGRFGRITEAVAKFPDLIGVGLAEDTGLIIKNNQFQVIGAGMAILFDGRKLEHNNEAILEEGTPMSLTNMITHVLSNGDQFEIKSRKIKVLPLEADFVWFFLACYSFLDLNAKVFCVV